MTYILTFISGLATLCLLLAIPYVIGTIAGRYADREGNSTVEEANPWKDSFVEEVDYHEEHNDDQ